MEFLKIANRSNFIIKEIPTLNPASRKYLTFWSESKRRCVDGFWSIDEAGVDVDITPEQPEFPKSNSWRYMPPVCYFYVNFGTILVKKRGAASGAKIPSRPNLDDVEWEFNYNWIEARGFSGFEFDEEYSCNRFLLQDLTDEELKHRCLDKNGDIIDMLYNNFFKKDGSRKDYMNVRTYIRQLFKKPLGRPVYGNIPKNLMLFGTRDGGKDLFENQIVIKSDGSKIKIKDIIIGDKIYGSNGKLTNVISKENYYDQVQYKVTLTDGREVICGGGHLWEVNKMGKKNLVIETKTMFDKFKYSKNLDGSDTYIYSIKQTKPVEYDEKKLAVNPYIMGALLGDGTMTTLTIRLACNDSDILDKFKTILGDEYCFKYDSSTNNNYNISYIPNRTRGGKNNPLKDSIFLNGWNLKGEAKHIPEVYKTSSIEQRLELVKGLMDTDGSCNSDGSCEFTNKSKKLIDDLAEVLRSLGIRCQIGIDNRTGYEGNIKGHKYIRGVYYRLFINTTTPIFHLQRKLNKQLGKIHRKSQDFISIKNIEKLEVMPSVCIGVDSIDNCFLTDNYVVTHNSWLASNVADHEILFDGIRQYEKHPTEIPVAEVVVGAAISDKSRDLLKKAVFIIDNLPGKYNKGTKSEIPCPFYKAMSGSIAANKDYEHKYKKKVGGEMKDVGTGAIIKHRIFTTENPEAAAGGRPGTIIVEEIGLMGNLISVHSGNVAAQNDSGEKFGSSLYLGTGGNVEKIQEAELIFKAPSGFEMLEFDNIWEPENQEKICWFIPATHMARNFKDANGNTDVEAATKFFERRRLDASKSPSKKAFEMEKMNYPLVPSEMFINAGNNQFPTSDIKHHYSRLMSSKKTLDLSYKVEFIIQEDGKIGIKNVKKEPIREYPVKSGGNSDISGCVEIFAIPVLNDDGNVPSNIYISSLDPIDDDDNTDITRSLQSFWIMNRLTGELCLEYTGRTEYVADFYEQCRRALIYYNARCNYENNKKGFFGHMYNKAALYLLVETPEILLQKDVQKSRGVGNKSLGTNTNADVISLGIDYILQWLSEQAYNHPVGVMNLHTIKSPALLREFLSYKPGGNFDRISSLILLFILREDRRRIVVDAKKRRAGALSDPFFNDDRWNNNQSVY